MKHPASTSKKAKRNKPETTTTSTTKQEKSKAETSTTTKVTNKSLHYSFQDKCNLIAELSEEILSDPQQNAFKSTREHSEIFAAVIGYTPPQKKDDKKSTTTNDDDANEKANDKKKNNNEEEEEEVFHTKRSRVKLLLDIAGYESRKQSRDLGGRANLYLIEDHVARLAMVSLLAIFSDILPGYRIRLPTAAQLSVRVAKETKKLWDYEKSLLLHYQMYLKLLENTWENGRSGGDDDGSKKQKRYGKKHPPTQLACTALFSLCELLKSAMHFNFRGSILSVVVRQMNHRSVSSSDSTNSEVEIAPKCCATIKHIFITDKQGEITLETVKLITKMIQNRKFNVPPRILETFFHIPLRVHQDEAQAAKLHADAKSAKKRKREKEGDGTTMENTIEEELQEGRSVVDKTTLANAQSQTLHLITLTYFRIIKKAAAAAAEAASSSSRSRDPQLENAKRLLPATLEGLAKFSHLVHFDTVIDLLGVLKQLLAVEMGNHLPLDSAFNCVLTSFQTLHGTGRELQVDQKEYILPLYNQLPRLCSESNSKHTPLALKCLNAAFIQRREYSNLRIAAFIKRLSTIALHVPPQYSAPILSFCRTLMTRYNSVHQLVESEVDVVAQGLYNPTADDPELCNPFATVLWETSLLKFGGCHHPVVARHASGLAQLKQLNFPVESHDNMLKHMGRDVEEGYIEMRVSKKKHPLREKGGSGARGDYGRKRNRQQQYRFITPRNKVEEIPSRLLK